MVEVVLNRSKQGVFRTARNLWPACLSPRILASGAIHELSRRIFSVRQTAPTRQAFAPG